MPATQNCPSPGMPRDANSVSLEVVASTGNREPRVCPAEEPEKRHGPFAQSFSQSALPAGGGRQADEDAQPTQEREVLAAVPASHHQTAAMKALGLDIGF